MTRKVEYPFTKAQLERLLKRAERDIKKAQLELDKAESELQQRSYTLEDLYCQRDDFKDCLKRGLFKP